MTDIATNTSDTSVITEEDHHLNTRVFRVMVSATGLGIAISALLGPWRFTVGLLIGGLLALFSHHWLANSARAAVMLATGGGTQQLRLFQFLLRYIVIAAVVFVAYQLEIASLTAMMLGLSSFVVAILFEAAREFYVAIISPRGN